MKSEILFGIRVGYYNYVNDALSRIAISKVYDFKTKNNLWTFSIKDANKVKALIGENLFWDCEEIKGLLNLQKKEILEEIHLNNYKGKDKIDIIEFPSKYQIITHRRDYDNNKINLIKNDVEKEMVIHIWEVIKKQPLNKAIKTKTLINNINKYFGIKNPAKPKVLRDTKNYIKYFYNPLKVLENLNVIKHHKSGKVEKIHKSLEIQGKMI